MAYISFQPKDYFNTKIYTGNGSAGHSITGVGFQPDWVWIKTRSDSNNHTIFDAVRGVTKRLRSNQDNAENTSSGVTSFDSDGFTVGSDSAGNSGTMVSWNWKANGAGSANTDGSINTTATSVNTTAGFSISTYTGTGSNATVGHGLGVVPNIVLVKSTSAQQHWCMYNSNLGNTSRLLLNLTNAVETSRSEWNSTTPTSSVFSVNNDDVVNGSSATYVAYCFAPIKGFSAMASYKGNGNVNGSFIYTGFSPAIIIAKKTSGVSDWIIWDNKRDGYNETIKRVYPNEPAPEENSTTQGVDFLSNGFKLRGTSSNAWNASGGSYIYMAFAEEPFVASNGVAATAR
jgi:hypothetical protein